MGAKDFIWVCWQEPASDCGKTSQIPYSWVTEVMIGDGRAPGSVLKCRWPKTRRQYTAKVIAPPSGQHEQSQMNILRIPLGPSSGDDDPMPSISEILAASLRSTGQKNNGDGDSSRSNSVSDGPRMAKDVSQKRPESKESFASASVHSVGDQSTDENEKDAESDGDSREYMPKPPSLVPETDAFDHRRYQSPAAFSASASAAASPAFPKELQKWFVLQLNSLKTELLNNFDQVNHKISAMDLSIRSIRDRVNRMEGKIDLALLNASPNGNAGSDDAQSWTAQSGDGPTTTTYRPEEENHPPPLKRQRTLEVEQGSSKSDGPQGGKNGDIQDTTEPWQESVACSSGISAISVTNSPPTPKRNARKSIVHRAAPISPPPLLIKQTPAKLITIDRRVHQLPTLATRVTPIAPATTSYVPSSAIVKTTKRRRSAGPMMAQYKPGSNGQIILLGGNPKYEISRQLYAETLENVYEETPVYLILSLVRRLLCDQDVAKLWFKADQPTQPNTYAFRPDFAEALKRQGMLQYPHKPLTERDYMSKLNQATYDAKHRVKHGKGSTSRPQSYFPLSKIAVLISPIVHDQPADSTSSIAKREPAASEFDSRDDLVDHPEEQADDGGTSSNGSVNDGFSAIRIKKEAEEEPLTIVDRNDHEDIAADNAMAMLAEMGRDDD